MKSPYLRMHCDPYHQASYGSRFLRSYPLAEHSPQAVKRNFRVARGRRE